MRIACLVIALILSSLRPALVEAQNVTCEKYEAGRCRGACGLVCTGIVMIQGNKCRDERHLKNEPRFMTLERDLCKEASETYSATLNSIEPRFNPPGCCLQSIEQDQRLSNDEKCKVENLEGAGETAITSCKVLEDEDGRRKTRFECKALRLAKCAVYTVDRDCR